MQMLLFVLHDTTKLNEVLDAWESVGITGVTILASTGLGRIRTSLLREDLPIMPSLQSFFEAEEELSRTMFTLIKDETLIDQVVAATEAVVGKLHDPNTGIMAVLPVSQMFGIRPANPPQPRN